MNSRLYILRISVQEGSEGFLFVENNVTADYDTVKQENEVTMASGAKIEVTDIVEVFLQIPNKKQVDGFFAKVYHCKVIY